MTLRKPASSLLLACSFAVGGLLGVAQHDLGGGPAPAVAVFASTCADQLGIAWSWEDGATEELDAFERCVAR